MKSQKSRLRWAILYLISVGWFIPIMVPATDQMVLATSTTARRRLLPSSPPFYDLAGKGESFTIRDGERQFNRGVKRDDTILVSGDRARFALLRILPEDTLMPDFEKFGDGRVKIAAQGREQWLDLIRGAQTSFHPGATEHVWARTDISGLQARLLITQAGNWGLVARLTLTNTSARPLDVQATWVWGGIARLSRTLYAYYFPPDHDDTPGDQVVLGQGWAVLREDKLPFLGTVAAYPSLKPSLDHARVNFAHELRLKPGQSQSVYLIASQSSFSNGFDARVVQARPEKLIAESRRYYEKILAPYEISTPSPILDSGFWTGILNLEYAYTAPAWLEGVHWWGAPFPNISQINAAMLLGQRERAQRALAHFGLAKEGDYLFYLASGKSGNDSNQLYDLDTFPYHLRDVMQYYEFTGDRDLMEKFWPRLMACIERMWKNYAGSDNLLLKFHFGSNMLMYQADNLGTPGVAAAPSLIMAGLPDKLADVAVALGKTADARRLKERSAAMYAALRRRLWNSGAGCFYNHVDLQGAAHMTHYYSDFVWPALYTRLPAEYGWQSLFAMNRALWLNPRGIDPPLMRVGDLKPSMFGDDNVMPFQMAEAARAYYLNGDKDRATCLLESVALAGTVFTEAPGNFPERMTDQGRGDANYIFGPPTGAYLMGVIDGLFGLGLTDGGQTVAWRPGFPEDWDSAHLKVPYSELTFKRRMEQGIRTDSYTVKCPDRKDLRFSVYLRPGTVQRVLHNGRPVKFTLEPALDAMRLELTALPARVHRVEIQYRPITLKIKGPAISGVGLPVTWDFGQPIKGVRDPQGACVGLKVEGNILWGEAGRNAGIHQLFVEMANLPVIEPVEVEIRPRYEVACTKAIYDPYRRTLRIETRVASPGPVPSSAVLKLSLLTREASLKMDWSGSGETTRTIEISQLPLLPESVYEVKCALLNGSHPIYETSNQVALAGKDSPADAMLRQLRDQRTRSVDLSRFYNTDTLRVQSCWNNGAKYVLDRADYDRDTGLIKTLAGNFKIPMAGHYMAMVEFGSSDPTTREIKRSDYPACMSIPIGQRARMLSLLYACEHESRNTFAALGRLRLMYKDGQTVEIPLVSGRNVDTINGHFAKDTLAQPVKIVNQEYWRNSSLDILRIPCDPAKELDSLSIEAELADFEFGLIGLNAIMADGEK